MKKRLSVVIVLLLIVILFFITLRDNDHDSLNWFAERSQKTSDFTKDSDNDGIPDNFDIHPLGGDANIVKYLEWNDQGLRYHTRLQIKSDQYVYYSLLPAEKDADFLTPNDPELKRVLKAINESIKGTNLSLQKAILRFVQDIPYTRDIYTGYDEYHKYPIQTLVEGTGDCEDKVFLAVSLLKAMNHPAIVLYYPGEHYALGIACKDCTGQYFAYQSTVYYYAETVSSDYTIGQVPKKFISRTPKFIT